MDHYTSWHSSTTYQNVPRLKKDYLRTIGSYSNSSCTIFHMASSKSSILWRSGKKIGKRVFIQKSAKSPPSALTHGIDITASTPYTHIIESVDSAKYLGVHVSQDMTWQTHVNRTAAKSSSTPGFPRRN